MSVTDTPVPTEKTGSASAPLLGLSALTAIVVGSMIGSGIFGLPSQMAKSAAPGPLLIGWLITGVGMLTLAFVFQTLAQRKPEVDGGVYGYAKAGFGNFIVPILTFIAVAIVGFKAGLFSVDFWGHHTEIDGELLGSNITQVQNMMLVTVWVFIGIEGAAVYSQRAKSRKDVGTATVIGFLAVLALLLLVNFLSYGLMEQAKIAGLDDPSMAGLMAAQVGSWGAGFISLGVIVSLLGALLAWVLLCAEILRIPAQEGVMPEVLSRENAHGSPAAALWLTNGFIQLGLVFALYVGSSYTGLVYLASSLILLPYLWSAAYRLLLACRGETYGDGHGRAKDVVIGSVALIYAIWLVYAGGWKYLVTAALFYLIGTALYVWARREKKLRVFTTAEWVVFAVIAAAGLAGLYLIIEGTITVLSA